MPTTLKMGGKDTGAGRKKEKMVSWTEQGYQPGK